VSARTRLAATAVAAAALLPGCSGDEHGGGDQARAQAAVREFVDKTNSRDTSLCDELLTARFLEQTTGQKGAAARRACKAQLKAVQGLRLELGGFKETKVEGDRATVKFDYEVNGVKQERTLELVKRDGRYRVDGSPTS
jgi:hypothetical protein